MAEIEELRGRWEMKLDSRGGRRRTVSKGAVVLPAWTERPWPREGRGWAQEAGAEPSTSPGERCVLSKVAAASTGNFPRR